MDEGSGDRLEPVPRHPFAVALDRPEEVAYWVRRLNRSEADVREAVEVAGPPLMKVLRYLSVIAE